jgi:molybdopterin-guanine dinucleotide biosynthesis protein A
MRPRGELPVGVVLAGGSGRRLGRPKGELRVGGRTLADRAAEALRPVCRRVLISVQEGARNPAPRFAPVADEAPAGRGPLAGIAAAFGAAAGADLLVLACDYPRVDAALLGALLRGARPGDALTAVADSRGRLHPLVGLWRVALAPAVHEALAAGRLRVLDLVAGVRVARLGREAFAGRDLDALLLNVNVPADLQALDAEPD